MIDTGLATRAEVEKIQSDFRNEIKHIELDTETLAKIYDEKDDQNDEMRESARLELREDMLKKKILKAEHMAEIKNIQAINKKVAEPK